MRAVMELSHSGDIAEMSASAILPDRKIMIARFVIKSSSTPSDLIILD